jgi:hypothetical protein
MPVGERPPTANCHACQLLAWPAGATSAPSLRRSWPRAAACAWARSGISSRALSSAHRTSATCRTLRSRSGASSTTSWRTRSVGGPAFRAVPSSLRPRTQTGARRQRCERAQEPCEARDGAWVQCPDSPLCVARRAAEARETVLGRGLLRQNAGPPPCTSQRTQASPSQHHKFDMRRPGRPARPGLVRARCQGPGSARGS